jgi:hypothetical protein
MHHAIPQANLPAHTVPVEAVMGLLKYQDQVCPNMGIHTKEVHSSISMCTWQA